MIWMKSGVKKNMNGEAEVFKNGNGLGQEKWKESKEKPK